MFELLRVYIYVNKKRKEPIALSHATGFSSGDRIRFPPLQDTYGTGSLTDPFTGIGFGFLRAFRFLV